MKNSYIIIDYTRNKITNFIISDKPSIHEIVKQVRLDLPKNSQLVAISLTDMEMYDAKYGIVINSGLTPIIGYIKESPELFLKLVDINPDGDVNELYSTLYDSTYSVLWSVIRKLNFETDADIDGCKNYLAELLVDENSTLIKMNIFDNAELSLIKFAGANIRKMFADDTTDATIESLVDNYFDNLDNIIQTFYP